MTEVVVIRLHDGHDLLAFLLEDTDTYFIVEHPYYVRMDEKYGVMTLPYCSLTDDIVFHIPKARVQFCLPASRSISYRFLYLIDAFQSEAMQESVEEDTYADRLEALIKQNNYVSGNDTKH